MARKTSKIPTKIWSFGARAPLGNAQAVDAQFLAGRVYRTTLAILEIQRRDELEKIRLRHPGYSEVVHRIGKLEESLRIVRDRIKAEQAQNRNKNVSDINRQQVKKIRSELADAYEDRKKQRVAADKVMVEEIEILKATDFQKTGKDLYNAAKVGDLRSGPYENEMDRQRRLMLLLKQDPQYLGAHQDLVAALLHAKDCKSKTPEKKAAQEAIKAARKAVAIAKKAAVKNCAEAIKKLDEERKTELEQVRAQPRTSDPLAPVFWGTKGLMADSARVAKGIEDRPRIRRWDGRGRIGVQLQPSYQKISSVFDGTNSFLRIDPVPAEAYEKGNKKLRNTVVHICIGAGEKGQREWASFPVKLHRQIPEDALVKYAWVKRSRLGTEIRYDFQMVLESRTFARIPNEKLPVVAIDIGWRQVSQQHRRIAYWYDDYGSHGEIVLPEEHRTGSKNMGKNKPRQYFDIPNYGLAGGMDLVERLRSIRDKLFNEARIEFVAWVKEQSDLPEWFTKAFARVDQWRSPNRLEDTVFGWFDRETKKTWRWRENRIAGDEQIFERVTAWCKKNRHLYQWEANERQQSLDRRKDFYRKIHFEFSKRYKLAVFEKFKLSEIAKLAPPEEKNELHETARHNRHESALSEFRNIFFAGMPTALVSPEHTTTTCHKCGWTEKFNAKDELIHKCPNPECSETWDQDYNAAVNLLVRYHGGEKAKKPDPENRESSGDGVKGGSAERTVKI